MENLGRAGGPVAELREVSAFPWDGVELVLLWIQVVRGPLLRTKIQSAGHVDQTLRQTRRACRWTHFVMTDDRVEIDELRVRHIGRHGVMLCVDVWRIAVVVRIPGQVRGRD